METTLHLASVEICPCHWELMQDHALLRLGPQTLLSEEESRALFAALAPLLHDRGWQWEWLAPQHWRIKSTDLPATGLPDLQTHANQSVREHIPASHALQTLQAEAQMVFYQHPVNDARLQRGVLPINALWFYHAPTHGAYAGFARRWHAWRAKCLSFFAKYR